MELRSEYKVEQVEEQVDLASDTEAMKLTLKQYQRIRGTNPSVQSKICYDF